MDKVILTSYRKLHKMCRAVDANVAARCALCAAPRHLYDHRLGEWVPLDFAKISSWQDSRVFLNNIISRLNGNKGFYCPPVAEQDKVWFARMTTSGGLPGVRPSSSTTEKQESEASSADSTTSASASSPDETPGAPVTEVYPYASLAFTLRCFYEQTPFSVLHLNNAFAAVRELSYACEAGEQTPTAVVSPAWRAACPSPPCLVPVAQLQPLHRVSLIKGLNIDAQSSLASVRTLHSRLRKHAKKEGGASPTADDLHEEEPRNAFDRPPQSTQASTEEEKGEAEVVDRAEDEVDEESTSPITPPSHVQLLLAHPKLTGFFRHSVLLMIRHADNDSAAFALNKPLESEHGEAMPVGATIRLSQVHPIFREHLHAHVVMIGGPVMSGSLDESLFLLHRIPNVPKALPLSESLWLGGDYDVLLDRLNAKEASADDIMVVCGFSGWGHQQLEGEYSGGTWVAVSNDSSGSRRDLDNFLMTMYKAAAGYSPTGAAPTAEGAVAEPELRRRHRAGGSSSMWVWAYECLGEPFAGMCRLQPQEK